MRFKNLNSLAQFSSTLTEVVSNATEVEKWNPTSYSIGRTGFNITNQNPQGYHPFCFSQSGYDLDTVNKVSTSDFKPFELFREDKNSFTGQNIFTCYSFPYAFNAVLIVAHLDNKFFSSNVISTQSFIKNKKITSPYLFRFFDDTNCGCGLRGLYTSAPFCPGDKKADPGAIIFLDRSSEINTVSLNYPEYVTRPLSNAILDYCNKNNKRPTELMPNLFWDEELQYY
jgi:hypothetical protein